MALSEIWRKKNTIIQRKKLIQPISGILHCKCGGRLAGCSKAGHGDLAMGDLAAGEEYMSHPSMVQSSINY